MTENELMDVVYITHAKTSLKNHTVEITGDFGERTQEEIAEKLTTVLIKNGYTLSVEKKTRERKLADFKVAVPLALGFIALFIVLQKIGIVNLVTSSDASYGTAFLIGVVASLSTCLAVVGGLVLSMSATFAKEGDKVKPQLLFHGGRLISFFVLGGLIGALGSVFQLNANAMFVLGVVIGVVMLILGINLLDIFHFTKKLQPSMPRFISRHAFGISKLNHTVTPFLVGLATFFLPCGFTQSMQIYTLSTGSFMKGGLTMLFFALGTLPVLALISFSSFSIQNGKKAGIFFKTAGLIVIMFAIFGIINSLVVGGFIAPVFNF